MDVKLLAARLESPNGWTRDAVQQLLIRTKSPVDISEASDELRTLATKGSSPQARLHALYAYEGLSAWSREWLSTKLLDSHPAVRKHALALYEDYGLRMDKNILDLLEKDRDDQLRQQLAYSLGTAGLARNMEHGERLARILSDNAQNPHIVAAGLSSISEKNWPSIFAVLRKQDELPLTIALPLIKMAEVYPQTEVFDVLWVLARQYRSVEDHNTGQMLLVSGQLLDRLDKHGMPFSKLDRTPSKEVAYARQRMQEVHAQVPKIVNDPQTSTADKLLAVRLLARGVGNDRDDQKVLVSLLTPRNPDALQFLAINQLARHDDPRTVSILLEPLKTYTPNLRGYALDTVLRKPNWTRLLVEQLRTRQLATHEIDATRRQRLLQHPESAVQQAAEQIFSDRSTPRGKVVDVAWLRLPDKGDAERGAKRFTKMCATCHSFDGVGSQLGPDLALLRDASPQGVLTSILDPNQAVEPRFINYRAVMEDGLTHSGIITGEDSSSITMVGPDGKKRSLLRSELMELASTGKSMMPDGLEKELSLQDIADLIAYIRGNQRSLKRVEAPIKER
jgi:putative heme-binding domain-containing protein